MLNATDAVQVVSPEAEAVGVRPGLPLSGAKLLCPSLIHRPYDLASYLHAAEMIWNALAVESSFVEPASPEVCFFDLTGRNQLDRVTNLIGGIRAAVGVEIQVALSSSRFVAEIAARNAEDGKPLLITEGAELSVTGPYRLDNLPDLDRSTREKLRKLGLHTIGDLVALGPTRLPKALQAITTTFIRRAQGLDSPPIQPIWPPRAETARLLFDDEVSDSTRLDEALRHLTAEIAGNLQKAYAHTRQISLSICYPTGEWQLEAEQTDTPIAEADVLLRTVRRLLKRLAPKHPICELVIEAMLLAAAKSIQLSLLDSNPGCGFLPYEREQRLSKGVQFLTRRFGVGSIMPVEKLHTATKVGLRTYNLGHMTDEPVEVSLNKTGQPHRVCRKRGATLIASIHDLWSESTWVWGEVHEHTVYRVITERDDLWELHRYGKQWRLRSLVD